MKTSTATSWTGRCWIYCNGTSEVPSQTGRNLLQNVTHLLQLAAYKKTNEAGPQTEPRVQWSGFGVQDLELHVYAQVLNPEPRTPQT